MKRNYLAAGVSLIIFGLILIIFGQYIINSAAASSSVSILGITISASASSSNNPQVQLGNAIYIIGIIIVLLGIPFLIYGGIASDNQKHEKSKLSNKNKNSVGSSEKHFHGSNLMSSTHRKFINFSTKGRLAAFVFLLVIVIVIVVAVILSNSGAGSIFNPQPIQFNLQINNPGSVLSSNCTDYEFGNSGTVNFNWATNNGGSVTFSVINQSGSVYSSDASNGAGSFYAEGGEIFEFCAYDWLS